MTMVSAQFPVSLRDEIARNAQAHDRSLSATLREAARVYLAQALQRGTTSPLERPVHAMTGPGGGRGCAAVAPAAGRRESGA